MTHSDWTQKALDLRGKLSSTSRKKRVQFFQSLPDDVRKKALSSPFILGRDKQVEALTSDADSVLLMAGRGFGKNFAGTHWILDKVQQGHRSLALVAETAADVRDDVVEPAEKNSGVVEWAQKKNLRPNYKRSESRIELKGPEGESRIQTYSGDSPKSLRGFSGSSLWIDELAKMRHPRKTLNQAELTLREGGSQLLITTTPRPLPVIKELVKDPDVHVITGSSWENKANLDARFQRKLKKMEGTRLGRQEIEAEILEDAGDLWEYEDIEHVTPEEIPDLKRVCVGLDPTLSNSDDSDEAGIVVVGLGTDGVAYVLADLSGTYTTQEWGAITVAAYQGDPTLVRDFLDSPFREDVQKALEMPYPWRPADVIHAETNAGGELINQQLRTYGTNAAVNSTHTSQSKKVRAEPVHHLYQRRKVKHVANFSELEDQMTDFIESPNSDSPDRVDSLVYSVNELFDLSRDVDRTKDAWETVLSI